MSGRNGQQPPDGQFIDNFFDFASMVPIGPSSQKFDAFSFVFFIRKRNVRFFLSFFLSLVVPFLISCAIVVLCLSIISFSNICLCALYFSRLRFVNSLDTHTHTHALHSLIGEFLKMSSKKSKEEKNDE